PAAEVRDRLEQQGRRARADEPVRGSEPLPHEGDEPASDLRGGLAEPRGGPRPPRSAGGGAAVPREGPVHLRGHRWPGYDSNVKTSPPAASARDATVFMAFSGGPYTSRPDWLSIRKVISGPRVEPIRPGAIPLRPITRQRIVGVPRRSIVRSPSGYGTRGSGAVGVASQRPQPARIEYTRPSNTPWKPALQSPIPSSRRT